MILDSLQNAGLYETIHPRFKQAFEFLRTTDLMALPLGKIELDGTNLFANIFEITGKTADTAKLETHNRYMDIQVPVTAAETMGWIAGVDLKEVSEEYKPEKDITFFADKATTFVTVNPKEFILFFPEDGHQPGICEGVQKKIVVKVLV